MTFLPAALCIVIFAPRVAACPGGTVYQDASSAEPPSAAPDDRLPRETERLLDDLVERGMPELIEPLVADLPTMHRIHLGRAYLRAGLETPDGDRRARFLAAGASEFRKVAGLERQPGWLVGERRRLLATRALVELGDLILRFQIAPDLDRYEITSGLRFNRKRIDERLREALGSFERAEFLLEDLAEGLRNDEDRFLLLGIAAGIRDLTTACSANLAWSRLYLALIADEESRERRQWALSALHTFDADARSAMDPTRKYPALLGAGMALRILGRHDEATAAFDRVSSSTAPAQLAARARLEKARLLIDTERFESARRELDILASRAQRGPAAARGDSVFYVRLVPLVRAYSFVREARSDRQTPRARASARTDALRALTSIVERGGALADAAGVYLDELAGGPRELRQMTTVELRHAAGRHMAEGQFADAAAVLEIILGREDPATAAYHDEARFNLAVCRFQGGDVRGAAEAFLRLATDQADRSTDDARRAAEYAYRCWRQIALESKTPVDCAALADAASALTGRFPNHPLAAEAQWVSAVALEQSGALDRARQAFEKTPKTSEHYWPARQAAVRCRQRQFDALGADTNTDGGVDARRKSGRAVAAAWLALAEDLEKAPASESGDDAQRLVEHAKLSAAAVLASNAVGDHRQGLRILERLPTTSRVLALRIQCHRAVGNLEQANQVLAEYLAQTPGAEAGRVLLGMASDLEAAVARLRAAGRNREAQERATETVEVLEHLLTWIQSQPPYRHLAPAVRFAIAKSIVSAGRLNEGLQLLDALVDEFPNNGPYLKYAANLHEKSDETTSVAVKGRAEALWARLLADDTLRDRSPEVYWEARYYWLRHRHRRGLTEEVVRGIRNERAWHPDLGGPPWQGRLLELLRQAESSLEANGP